LNESIAVPITTQLDVVAHDVAVGYPEPQPLTVGANSWVHEVPFQRGHEIRLSARQLLVAGQVTSTSGPMSAPPGWVGAVTRLQLAPFHRISSAEVSLAPTAQQLPTAGHDTAASELAEVPDGCGVVTIDHAVPFQCCASVRRPEAVSFQPTATQNEVLAHDTSSSAAPSELPG
jgi:hypothetical protein